VVGGSFALAIGTPAQAGKPIHSIAADFDFFGFFEEAATASEPPVAGLPGTNFVDGLRIYDKVYNLSGKSNIVTIEMFTTGDSHAIFGVPGSGPAGCFTCIFTDPTGARGFCNPGGQGAARCANNGATNVPGWIALIKEPEGGANCFDGGGGAGDCHDNAISYKWCYAMPVDDDGGPITGLYRTELWMASSHAGGTVFIEQAHFYINETKVLTTDNDCADPTPGGGFPGGDL
jgi:hypothetical protein